MGWFDEDTSNLIGYGNVKPQPDPATVERPQSDFARIALSAQISDDTPDGKLKQLRDGFASSSWEPGTENLLADASQKVKMDAGMPLVPDATFAAYAQNAQHTLPGTNGFLQGELRDNEIDKWAAVTKADMRLRGGVDYLMSAHENNAYVDQIAHQWKREGNVSTSPIEEGLKRLWGGAADSLTGMVGAHTTVEQDNTDPRYDDKAFAKLMSGLGNGVATTGAVVATGGLFGGLAEVGALVGGSTAQVYSQVWGDVYDKTGSRKAATSAALNAWPTYILNSIAGMVEIKGIAPFLPGRANKIAQLSETILGSTAEAGLLNAGLGYESSKIIQKAEAPYTGQPVSQDAAIEAGLLGGAVGGIIGGGYAAVRGQHPEIKTPLVEGKTRSEGVPLPTEPGISEQPSGMPAHSEPITPGDSFPTPAETNRPPRPDNELIRLPDVINAAMELQRQIAPTGTLRAGYRELLTGKNPEYGQASEAQALTRIAKVNDLGTTIHEVFHHAFGRFATPGNERFIAEMQNNISAFAEKYKWNPDKISPEIRDQINAEAAAGTQTNQGLENYIGKDEVVKHQLEFLGKQVYPQNERNPFWKASDTQNPRNGEPPQGWAREGFSELGRMLTTGNVSEANQGAAEHFLHATEADKFFEINPQIRDWFYKEVLPAIGKNIDERNRVINENALKVRAENATVSVEGDGLKQQAAGLLDKAARKVADTLAPQTRLQKAIKGTSGEEFIKAFEKVRELARGYNEQTSEEKGRAAQDRSILTQTGADRFMKGVRGFFSDLKYKVFDRTAVGEELQSQAEETFGQKLLFKDQLHNQMTSSIGMARAWAENWFYGRPHDLGELGDPNNKHVGRQNLEEILKAFTVKGKKGQEEISHYLYALRAEYAHGMGEVERRAKEQELDKLGIIDPKERAEELKNLTDYNPGITAIQAKEMRAGAEARYPELKEIAPKLGEWSVAFLESSRNLSGNDTLSLTLDNMAKMRKAVYGVDPDIIPFYAPLWRGIGGQPIGKSTKEFTGDTRSVGPVFEELPKAMIQWGNKAFGSQQIETATRYADYLPGLGKLISRLAHPPENINKKTGTPSGASIVTSPDDKFVFFEKQEVIRNKNGDITDSKQVYYEVDKRLANALRGGDFNEKLGAFTQTQFFHWAFRVPKQLATLGLVATNPAFLFLTEAFRHPVSIWYMRGENDGTALQTLSTYYKTLGEAMIDPWRSRMWTDGAHYPDIEQAKAMGISRNLNTFLGDDPRSMYKFTQKMMKFGIDGVEHASSWEQLLDKVQRFAINAKGIAKETLGAPELAKHLTQFRLKEFAMFGDTNPTRSYTEEQYRTLWGAARGMTGDFARGGSWVGVQFMGLITPFLNQHISGSYENFRALGRTEYIKRAAGMATAAALYAIWHRQNDSDWWDEVPDGVKYRNWIFKIPGTRTLIKIPKAFNLDAPASAVEAAIDTMGTGQLNRIKGVLVDGFQAHTIGYATLGQAPAVKAFLDQITNNDIKTDMPIESAAMLWRVAPERFNDYTSETAKFLGQKLGWSPARIEKGITDLTGNSFLNMAKATESLAGVRHTPPGGHDELTFLGSMVPKEGIDFSNGKSINEFYNNYNNISFRSVDDTDITKQLRAQMRDAGKAMAVLNSLMKGTDNLNDRAAYNSQRMKIAQEANAAYKAQTIDRGKFSAYKSRTAAINGTVGSNLPNNAPNLTNSEVVPVTNTGEREKVRSVIGSKPRPRLSKTLAAAPVAVGGVASSPSPLPGNQIGQVPNAPV